MWLMLLEMSNLDLFSIMMMGKTFELSKTFDSGFCGFYKLDNIKKKNRLPVIQDESK